MAGQLVFLHLSDIHFHTWSGSAYDDNALLRETLLQDAGRVQEVLDVPARILITGDIGFRAAADEYVIARRWLEELCNKFSLPFTSVRCIPGNHDIDQGVIKKSKVLEDVHNKLRAIPPTKLSTEIRDYMEDPIARQIILTPLDEYNGFAAPLQCQVVPDSPTWYEDFILNDTSGLRLWGLNSTIVSDHLDNDYKTVVIGEYQLPTPKHGVVNIVMCHHPPDWWRDPDSVADGLEAHCRVQLFGHKHTQKLKKIDNTLVLTAGAVQPDKTERNWEPRYNWLALSVSGIGTNRKLCVQVFPRIWEPSTSAFVPDSNRCNGKDHRTELLVLEDWKPVDGDPESAKGISGDFASVDGQPATPEPAAAKEINPMEPARILTYRFFDLPHVTRIDIACELELYMDEDEGLQDFELFDRILRRAIERDLLARLWEEVEIRHGDGKYKSNPFEKKPS